MEGAVQERGTFRGIAALLLSLALLAERTAGRSFPVRFLVLVILFRAEVIARTFVAREIATDWPDSPCLEEPGASHYGVVDAQLLALRLRMLAVVLGALAEADGCSDDRPAGWPARLAPDATAGLPVLLVVRFPAAYRRQSPPHDTS